VISLSGAFDDGEGRDFAAVIADSGIGWEAAELAALVMGARQVKQIPY